MITSVVDPIGNSTVRNGFNTYSSISEKLYHTDKFIGADVRDYNTFRCNYEATDGTHITTKFTSSKCQAMVGFDISGECSNSDPQQCTVICSY